MRSVRVVVVGLVVMSFAGCGSGTPDGPRVAVSPIKGQINVDGLPAANLKVTCTPLEGQNTSLPTAGAFTDDQGRFAISSYESGDGAPPGEYALTFEWGQYNLMNGRYGGPDKLGGLYSDPETSDHTVAVVEGLPTDLGTIELTTNGIDD